MRRYYAGRPGYRREGGYVYLIQEGEDGPVKIGWAKNPATRLEDFQTGNSRELRIVASFPGGINDERELHKRFAAHRLRGEWFEPVPALFSLLELAQ